MDGQPKDAGDANAKPVHMDEVLIEIGGKNTVPEFTQNLRALLPAMSTRSKSSIPKTLTDKRLAGKTFVYTVKVQWHQAEEACPN